MFWLGVLVGVVVGVVGTIGIAVYVAYQIEKSNKP
jgi:preprotein translocase subunit SecF